jgi:thiosulfate/3-mercaptopyruvate sulfurtransferase
MSKVYTLEGGFTNWSEVLPELTTAAPAETEAAEVKEALPARTVYVDAAYVKDVIDGKMPESENYVIVNVAYPMTSADFAPYGEGHIPGSIYASIMEVEDATGDNVGAYNLLAAEEIRDYALSHGITKDTVVILYGPDISGVGRQAYGYIYMGVENVKILNGGLDAWTAAGYELETTENVGTPAADFGCAVPAHPEYWTSIEDAKTKPESDPNFKLVSIRSEPEWLGQTSGYGYMDKAGEPKGAVWGKGAQTAGDVADFTNEDGTVKDFAGVTAVWEGCDFTLDNHLAFYCGTGWRATVPFLVLYQEGYDNISVFDGGWYQWLMDDSNAVQVGDPAGDVVYTTVGELPTGMAAK